MGRNERRARERLEIRRIIMDAARQLFVAENYASVPIRLIADAVEYSPAAIYRYFKSKDDIFFALAEEGAQMLKEHLMRLEYPVGANPIDRLRQGFWAHYEFSKAHPEYYYLIFMDRSAPRSTNHRHSTLLDDLLPHLLSLIDACRTAGKFPAQLDRGDACDTLFVSVHGPATLQVCGRRRKGSDLDRVARNSLEIAITGLSRDIRAPRTARRLPGAAARIAPAAQPDRRSRSARKRAINR